MGSLLGSLDFEVTLTEMAVDEEINIENDEEYKMFEMLSNNESSVIETRGRNSSFG